MTEIIAFIQAVPGTVPLGAVLTLAIFAIIKGWLIPKHIVDARMQDKEAEISRLRDDRDSRYDALVAEKDQWRSAHESSELSRQELLRQNSDLLEVSKTVEHVLLSLPRLPSEKGGGSHD